jgi:hypothetical protein
MSFCMCVCACARARARACACACMRAHCSSSRVQATQSTRIDSGLSYTLEKILQVIMLFHHFGFRVIHLAGKEFTKKGRRVSNTCRGHKFNSCWLWNLLLDFEVCQNWKVSSYSFEFGQNVGKSSLGTHGSWSAFCFKSPMTVWLCVGWRKNGPKGQACGARCLQLTGS